MRPRSDDIALNSATDSNSSNGETYAAAATRTDDTGFNYRRLRWTIVIGVFVLFFIADSIEHGVLPKLHPRDLGWFLAPLDWFLTTVLATLLAYFGSGPILRNLEAVHRRLIMQSEASAAQAAKLAQQSERLALSVQEAHHRIKNNLQIVAALLTWTDQNENPQDALQDIVTRIRAIALVHDFLTHDKSLTTVNVAEVIEQLVCNLLQGITSKDRVDVAFDLEEYHMTSQHCTSVALIVNELILNALEHSFPGKSTGSISVSLHARGTNMVLRVTDNGGGLPSNFSLRRDMQTGLNIACSLAEEDLNGTLRLTSSNGTVGEITFPRTDAEYPVVVPGKGVAHGIS